MADRRYLTTPIYYASGAPHIGHAYTTILADALARFERQSGREVRFLTGTDEHGQKIQEEANRQGVQPIELCDEMAERFRDAWDLLDIDYDRFIRTTEAEHIAVVRSFVQRLYDRGHIYAGEYSGWYSVSQERYFTEKEIGPDRVDPIAGKPVEWVEEENWFFRMSAFQDDLIAHIEANPDWIRPEVRRNEILGFLQQPLGDLSISRPKRRLRWGVELPFATEHVAYVWVDALINYVTASGAIPAGTAPDDPAWDDVSDSWWPADLHLIGKDILTTHAVYWPTLLMGAGLPLPRGILAHGWWVVGETKMSKSLGNVIDPLQLRDTYGTDAVRWYLLREMPTGSDASYTPERFLTRYEELANVWGNLAQRALSMVARYRDGVVPDGDAAQLDAAIDDTLAQVGSSLESLRLHEALGAAMDLARTANGYVEEREPWAQAKDPARAGNLDDTLATLVRVLTVLTALFHPVCPGKAAELAGRLGLSGVPTLDAAKADRPAGRSVEKGDPLFPRIEN
ncbi:methionine--tRNA ligase [Gaopeijia maritima]|uniref:methionine--tRNA ligase n=1 Tax=Gaopeijia maritima TaxID=3119007 RepID=UPI00324D8F27